VVLSRKGPIAIDCKGTSHDNTGASWRTPPKYISWRCKLLTTHLHHQRPPTLSQPYSIASPCPTQSQLPISSNISERAASQHQQILRATTTRNPHQNLPFAQGLHSLAHAPRISFLRGKHIPLPSHAPSNRPRLESNHTLVSVTHTE
jgi:hypothetical protein